MSTETDNATTTEEPQKSFWEQLTTKPGKKLGDLLAWSFAWAVIIGTMIAVFWLLGFILLQFGIYAHYTDFSSFRWSHVVVVLLVTVAAIISVKYFGAPRGVYWIPVLLVVFLLVSYLDLFGFNWSHVIIVALLLIAFTIKVRLGKARKDVFWIPVILAVFLFVITFWIGPAELVWALAYPESGLLFHIGQALRHPLVALLFVAVLGLGIILARKYFGEEWKAWAVVSWVVFVTIGMIVLFGLATIGFVEGLLVFAAIVLNVAIAGAMPVLVIGLMFTRSIYKLDTDGQPIREDDETDEIVTRRGFDADGEPTWERPDGTEVPESETTPQANWLAWVLIVGVMFSVLIITGATVEVTM